MKARAGAALITGGAQRLGQAMALCLAARGYDLVIHYHRSEAAAHALQAEVAEFGARASLIQGDLSQRSFLEGLLQQALAAEPGLNLLINNASAFYPKTLLETDLETLDVFFDLHLKAPLVLTRDFARAGLQGQVVNLIDTQVQKYPVQYAPYILSKKALSELTLLSAKSLGPEIRVNAIAPGYILKPVAGNPDDAEHWLQRTPLQRIGQITDITQALESLLDNPFLTGQILWVDGGARL